MEEHNICKNHFTSHLCLSLFPPPAPPRNDLGLTLDRFEPSFYTSCGAKASHMSCASTHLEIATEARTKVAAHMTQRPMLHLFHAASSQWSGLLQNSALFANFHDSNVDLHFILLMSCV